VCGGDVLRKAAGLKGAGQMFSEILEQDPVDIFQQLQEHVS
jgi:hypothetical protein